MERSSPQEVRITISYTAHQLADYLAAVEIAQEAIEAAASTAEVEAILAELKQTIAAVEASCPAKSFRDVAEGAWYHEAVDYVVLSGMMKGKSSNTFAPEDTLTRAELVTVLYRMVGEPSVEGLENPFADIPAGEWYTDAVIWAYHAQVVNGTTATTFSPDSNTSREQIAVILYRFCDAEAPAAPVLDAYADADTVSDWALDGMSWAFDTGIINGMDAVTLSPKGTASRAQIATILMRFCEMTLA